MVGRAGGSVVWSGLVRAGVRFSRIWLPRWNGCFTPVGETRKQPALINDECEKCERCQRFFFFLAPSSLTENLRFSWVFFFLVFSPAGSAVCLEVEQKSALRFAYSILIWSLWKSFRKLGRTRESRFRAEPSVEDSPQRVVWFRRLAWSVSSCDQSRQQTMV